MKWSWKIGRFASIDVYLHTTFFLLIGWIAYTSWIGQNSIAAVLSGVGFILALFASVVFHEYGHALTARKFGIETRDITLYPIGGVAKLEKIPENPKEEFYVALAGPVVNVLIAAILFIGLVIYAVLDSQVNINFIGNSFIERLIFANLILVGFNLIPAFPMDGGRVLRALLAMRLDYSRATRIAASVGQVAAFIFAVVGFFSNPFLILIALFIWVGAQGESQMVQVKAALRGIPNNRAMLTNFKTLSPYDSISKVVQVMLTSEQKDFPVVNDSKVVGVLTQRDLMKRVKRKDEDAMVSSVMRTDYQTVDPQAYLENSLTKLRDDDHEILLVVYRDHLVGLLTLNSIDRYLRIQSNLKTSRSTIAS